MNIYGNELRIKKIKQQLKLGEKVLGSQRYNKLLRFKKMHENIIKKIREERKKNG